MVVEALAGNVRGTYMRYDTAVILKRLFLVERMLVVSQAGTIAHQSMLLGRCGAETEHGEAFRKGMVGDAPTRGIGDASQDIHMGSVRTHPIPYNGNLNVGMDIDESL
ncbi:MAG TPA: hypothetical protein PKX23_11030, partial [Verrucomicrobiota bacterium]|nr:hypothetical protein [Verrucomicrobiota bacterium]